jgi:hypothetical protein
MTIGDNRVFSKRHRSKPRIFKGGAEIGDKLTLILLFFLKKREKRGIRRRVVGEFLKE